MVKPQSTQEILFTLQQAVGELIREVQILGVNSLKSITPAPQDLVGSKITGVQARERNVRIDLEDLSATLDLQRTGRVVWLDSAGPAQFGDPGLPTVRLLLESGSAVDFTERGETKRISVTLSAS